MKPIVLCIMDGYGLGPDNAGNAIKLADTPNLDQLFEEFPSTSLHASGSYVGLPEGQMGNSEVGHLNIGAGRVVKQALVRINEGIEDFSFSMNDTLTSIMFDDAVHIIGLVSDGGVHSHIKHIREAIDAYVGTKIWIHVITDGRDVSPESAKEFIHQLDDLLDDDVRIATISGRYYAMDRDKRWDRVKLAYDAIVKGEGHKIGADDINAYIDDCYSKGIYDEFIYPVVVGDFEGINDDEGILFANYRPDRMVQLASLITNPAYLTGKKFDEEGNEIEPEEGTKVVNERPEGLDALTENMFVTMTDYGDTVKAEVVFPPEDVKNGLGEVLAAHKQNQLRIAETEKYPHVTYFFNGGREEEYKREQRILVKSPKVATYDLEPEMSAEMVTERLLIELPKKDVVILNYANCDMVGHTGDMEATITAVETIDQCIGELYEEIEALGGTLILTADHGNADEMFDDEGNVITKHSMNKVPFLITNKDAMLKESGSLCDIAPTILYMLQIKQPEEMTGTRLIIN